MGTEFSTLEEGMPIGCGCAACASRNDSSYDVTDTSLLDNSIYDQVADSGSDPLYAMLSNPSTDRALQLSTGLEWGNGGGEGVTITYSFLTAIPGYYSGGAQEQNQFHEFTDTMKDAARNILDMISTYADITFTEVSGVGDMTFAQAWLTSGSSNPGAWAYYPDQGNYSGDVWTNYKYASSFANPSGGNYGWYALTHEIGHALGLKHTFEAFNLDATNSTVDNTEKYSVMAYNWDTWGYTYAETLQLYDIYALQSIYGANTSYNTGSTTYTLRYGDAYTIYDAGGTDIFDASAQSSAVTINLNDGEFSSVGLTENIAIAYGTVIENATGGSAGDTIYGNEADNVINGGGGGDTIYASAGDDTLDGEDGSDTLIYTSDITDFFIRIIDSVTLSFRDLVGDYGEDTAADFENFIFNNTSYTWSDVSSYAQSLDPMQIKFFWDGGQDITYYEADSSTYRSASDIGNDSGDSNVIAVLRDFTQTTVNILDSGTNLIKLQLFGQSTDESIRVIGTHDSLDAVIFGGDGSDSIKILITGNDRLYGEAGDDTIQAGAGNDELYGGTGNDDLQGEAGNDTIYAGDGDDIVDGGSGNDSIYGDDVYGESGNIGNDTLSGGAGDDIIYGNDGDDTINGDGDADRLYGGAGLDIINGGDGSDRIYGQEDDDTLHGNNGNDTLYGEDGSDDLSGDSGIDWLYGGDGDDTLDGGTETDYLFGGDGSDTVYGGAGNDFLYGDNVPGESGNTGDDILYGEDGNDILYGHSGNDTLYGGNDQDKLYGHAGNDTLNGDGGIDRLYGNEGDDTLNGGGGNDKLYGQEDDDILNGGDGDDLLFGDGGNDTLNGDNGSDWLYGGEGSDTLDGGANTDYVYGNDGDDIVSGGTGNDFVYGGSGQDVLNGNDGTDRLFGGDDNDTLNGDNGSDKLFGQSGDDTLNGGIGNDKLYGQEDNDILNGGDGDDTLNGDGGNDTLNGDGGNDWLYGGDGNDTLIGGDDADYLYGGNGSDIFGFTNFDGVRDQIRDFTYGGAEGDVINITDILSGYIHEVSDINDFVLIDFINSNAVNLKVDMNGNGDNFKTVARVFGADLTGVDAQDLLDDGTLIANQTLL